MGRASRQKKLRKTLSPLAELKKLGQIDGVMMNIEGAVPEDWRKADQEYFKQHPNETVYIRSAFPGELPQLPNVKKVEVRLIAEGTRTRRPVE
ncbi:hypothetical protein [Tolypothrix sp. VBCCA 56010]|uniref:hypothetical protein n=1 Tax=Tolypothrix sp. VBCCA 56010 TaxID=3137731 RepID=UPI003D7CD102